MENQTKMIGYEGGAEAYELTAKENLLIWGLVIAGAIGLLLIYLFWETVSDSIKIGVGLGLVAFVDALISIKRRVRNAKK
ncbi:MULTISPECIES: hypothetical protein [Olivibacter]|uniref:Uncharacterized protein n=1 Tax=Olivibacter jilunii TaxID=985016 RepID=A0ABW6AW29_9SPHI